MSRQNMIVIALGVGTLALSPLSLTPAHAQSGDALAHAERTCTDNGVGPNAASFDTCVSRSAVAFDEGQPDLAVRQAVMVRNANDVCQSYGIAPVTMGYKQCVGNEIEKSTVTAYNISYVPGADEPHATAAVDSFGFHFDRDGNLIDRNGYVIRAVP